MYVLLGNRYMKEGDYERAVQLFDHARASDSSHRSPRLEIISLVNSPWFQSPRTLSLLGQMSGWYFDGLELVARQHLREALHAAGRTKDATDSLVEVNR